MKIKNQLQLESVFYHAAFIPVNSTIDRSYAKIGDAVDAL